METPSWPWELMGSWLLPRLQPSSALGHCCSRCHRGTANTCSYHITKHHSIWRTGVTGGEHHHLRPQLWLDMMPTDTEKSVSKQIQDLKPVWNKCTVATRAADGCSRSCKWRSGSSPQTDSHGRISQALSAAFNRFSFPLIFGYSRHYL